MEKTVQTRRYQDPLEGSFEKLVPWTFTFTNVDENSTVHIAADDWSDRKISLPIGVILEIKGAGFIGSFMGGTAKFLTRARTSPGPGPFSIRTQGLQRIAKSRADGL